MNYKAWIATAAKQPMTLETVDLGPLGAEDVEVAVERTTGDIDQSNSGASEESKDSRARA